MQYFLRGSRQHCIRENLGQCCLNALGTALHRTKPYALLSKKLQTTLHKKKFCSMLFEYSWNNNAQVKTLCNVLSEKLQTTLHKKKFCSMLPEYSWVNIALVKTLCNVVWEAPGSIAYEKVLFNVNTLRTTLHRSKPYAILSERLQTTLHRKSPVQYSLNTPGITLHRSKAYAVLSEKLQITLLKKKSCSILS